MDLPDLQVVCSSSIKVTTGGGRCAIVYIFGVEFCIEQR